MSKPRCPVCDSLPVATLVVDGEFSNYCAVDDDWYPPVKGSWSRWNPKPGDYDEEILELEFLRDGRKKIGRN